ncbi:unnamed protein product [Macrosiphum euphorbiae]|uniref:Uncharacterized protein n=1 Tax=Macrosiphum euphorbiae TaxID=13131 RepID=A0AAV0WSL7_9HEMI|nr:unnamed protein product [Macrosiphum euphorbiae]
MRNKLSHLVITHSLKEASSKKISTSKLISLSQEIIDIFPGENKQTYNIPYRKENGKVTPTRGKLWDKYCNLRRELRNLCTTNKLQDEVVSTSVNYNKELTEDNILWLQNNIAPWNEDDIPAIKSPLGFTLFEYDFELLYPGKDPMILFIKCELFKKKLPVYVQKSNYKGIDKLVVNEILEPTVPGYDNIAALKTFIELFQPIKVSKRSISGNQKNKILELKQSFIYYVNSTCQLKEVNEDKRKKAQLLDQTLQPVFSGLVFYSKIFFELETNFDKNYQNINNIIHDLNNC